MTLYEIGQQYLEALEQLQVDPETGEIVGGELVAQMAGEFDEKCEATACYIKQLKYEIQMLKAERQILTKRLEPMEKRAQQLRQYLADWMTAAGRDKLDTPRAAISWRKSTVVVVENLNTLPPICKKERVEADKTMIRKLLKLGDKLEGAHLEESRNLQIK